MSTSGSEKGHSKTRLAKLGVGQSGTISEVKSSDQELLRKLVAMGIVQGTSVEVSNIAPLGDPIEIKTRGYHLSLRRSEADCVEVVI